MARHKSMMGAAVGKGWASACVCVLVRVICTVELNPDSDVHAWRA